MTHLQEKNWSNIFGHLTPEGINWCGTWTIYSPELEVIKSYQGIRSFRHNEDKTVIYQTNNYTYADGSTNEKHWQFNKQICNQIDGVAYTEFPSMRILSIAHGVYAWLKKQLESSQKFSLELFFSHEDWRTSVVIIYGENSTLEKIVQIREHLNSFPPKPPDAEARNIDGKWIGKKQQLTPDLTVSNTEIIQDLVLVPLGDKNQTLFLPDGVVINAPTTVKIGQEFSISIGRMVYPNQFKRLTAQYDNGGNFQLLISEIFHRQ